MQAGHVAIINSTPVRSLVSDWYTQASLRSKREVGNKRVEFQRIVVAEAAATGRLLPVALDASKWSENEQKFAITVNSQALKLMGYSTTDVAGLAKAAPNPQERARLFAVAASDASSPATDKLAWTSEVARYSYLSSRYDEAIGSSQVLLDTVSKEMKPDDPNTRVLLNQAKEVMGWAYLRKGDINQFNGISKELALAGHGLKEPKTSAEWFVPGWLNPDLKSSMTVYQPKREWPKF
jgi:hypothetical protein